MDDPNVVGHCYINMWSPTAHMIFYHLLYIKTMSQANSITKNQRLRSSNFYITINSNKSVVLVNQLTPEEEAYFQQFDTTWRRYFNQSPDVWLKFLMPGDNTENSVKSIVSLAHSKLQLSRRSMIHAHRLIEIKHYTKVHLEVNKVCTNIDMVVIRKNWQALPVTATTVTAPIIEDCPRPAPVSSYMPPLDPIQLPTADIVELNEINHDEPNEPAASTYLYSNNPPPVWPKKRLRIIKQRGLLDQFSFSSSSLMIGGAVIAGLVLIMSAGKGTVKTRIGQDSLSGFY